VFKKFCEELMEDYQFYTILFFILVAIFPFLYSNLVMYLYMLMADLFITDIYETIKWFFLLNKFYFIKIMGLFDFFSYDIYINFLIYIIKNFYNSDSYIIYIISSSYIYISIILIQIFLLTLTIWTRACGPRVRIDQIINLTWKEFLINLFMLILLILLTFIFF